jgi:hypothetical protein
MGYKKFLISFLTTCLIMAGLYSLLIFRIDPLGYYNNLIEKSHYYSVNGRFQLPAFIKNLNYDTVIIGPSMSQNFREKVIDHELNVKSFNAALSAASAKEQNYIYQLANNTHKDLKNVYWEINFDSLYGDSDRVNEESGVFPKYLYNNIVLDDYKYLFSYYAGELYFSRLKAERIKAGLRTPYDVYKFGYNVPPQTPKQYKDTKVINNNNPVPEGVSFRDMKENFDVNILPVLKDHPEQSIKLYYTPYPITYHIFNYNRSRQAFIDRLKIKEYIFEQVKDLDHVEIYDFQAESKVTFTISNYLDGSHYFMTINDWMVKQFAEHNYLQTMESTTRNNKLLLEQVEKFSVKQLVAKNN